MNEILGFFFHPEVSAEMLLNDKDQRKWREGILKWILVAILAGLLSIVTYQLMGEDLKDFLSSYYNGAMQGLLKIDINEGFIWLALAGVNIGEILIAAVIRVGIWTVLLYIGSKVLKDEISLHQIVKMSIYVILIWITSQLFLYISMCISMLVPIRIINLMLLSLGMLLNYWYLILFTICYSILSKGTFWKGAIIVLVIQAIIWGITNIFPILETFLA